MANPLEYLGKPGVEYRAKDGREIVLRPPDEIRFQGWHYGRQGFEGPWHWFPNQEEAEKFFSGSEGYQVYT